MADFASVKPPAAQAKDDEHDDDVYPGSKKKRKAVAKAQGVEDVWEEFDSYVMDVGGGVELVFYSVGVLAQMLNREPQTVRKWERQGYLPLSKYRTPGRTVHGQKRSYTRPMIEGLVRIAKDEGVYGNTGKKVGSTAFPEKANRLFHEMGVLG